MAEVICFSHGKLLRNHTLKEENLWISKGKIIAPQKKADVVIQVKGKIIAPGYIDLQTNGGYGIDLKKSPEKWEDFGKEILKHGVTSFLATIISSHKKEYPKILSKLKPSKNLLGIHLEGPFLSKEFAGAHEHKTLQSSLKNLLTFYGNLDNVKMITLAPELPYALDCIKELKKQGIIPAAGHSKASFDEIEAAQKAGLNIVSHLFNTMTPFHHRAPGIVGKVLTSSLYYSLIVDGIHVHPDAIRFAWKANPEGLILITDSIEAFGKGDGKYLLGNQILTVKQGKATLKDSNTIAGSILGMDQAVRNLHAWTGCSIPQALEAASLKPATLLGIQKKKGTLNVGADADFIILDKKLNIQSTYLAGQKV